MKRGVQEPLSFEAYGGKHSLLLSLSLNVTRKKIWWRKRAGEGYPVDQAEHEGGSVPDSGG